MTVRNFRVKLANSTVEAARQQAGQTGQSLEQIVTDLLKKYANGETEMTTYTVRRGDTLTAIARRFYGDAHKYPIIQNANNINDANQIRVGQVLLIPAVTASPQTPPSPASRPHDEMERVPAGFKADKAGSLQAIYCFQRVDSGDIWTVHISNGRCTVSRGQTVEPDVTIGISRDDMKALARGQLNLAQAYREGRVGVRGNVELAARFTDIFGPWQ